MEAFEACTGVLEGPNDFRRDDVLALVMADYLAHFAPDVRNAIFESWERKMRTLLAEHPLNEEWLRRKL